MRASTPRVVLGVCAFTHDSAAALLVHGHLVGFVEEERLSGIKHDRAFPQHAVAWLLHTQGLDVDDVDEVAYNFVPGRFVPGAVPTPRQVVDDAARARARSRSFLKVAGRTQERLHDLRRRFPRARVRAVPHHRAHGLYAFAASGVDDAGVLVLQPHFVMNCLHVVGSGCRGLGVDGVVASVTMPRRGRDWWRCGSGVPGDVGSRRG